jgi:hypothetical protein
MKFARLSGTVKIEESEKNFKIILHWTIRGSDHGMDERFISSKNVQTG